MLHYLNNMQYRLHMLNGVEEQTATNGKHVTQAGAGGYLKGRASLLLHACRLPHNARTQKHPLQLRLSASSVQYPAAALQRRVLVLALDI